MKGYGQEKQEYNELGAAFPALDWRFPNRLTKQNASEPHDFVVTWALPMNWGPVNTKVVPSPPSGRCTSKEEDSKDSKWEEFRI